MPETLDLLTDLIAKARKAGADAADAVHVSGTSLSLAMRLGETEKLERSEGQDLGLRVFVGRRQAVVSSSDPSEESLDELVTRAVAMAREVPEDPYCGIADPDQLASELPTLDSSDPGDMDVVKLTERARQAEAAARAVPGVTNSEGAEAGWQRTQVCLAASNGFTGQRAESRHSLSASVLAGEGTAMERDYDYDSAVYLDDLRGAEDIGRTAGEKAVRRLNPQKIPSATLPVIYDPRVSRSLVGHLISAITGPSIARGTSYLKDKMEQAVCEAGIDILEDPHRNRGLRSKGFDAEGLATRQRKIIDGGSLTTWLLDLRSARQLGLTPTGHAARGTGGPPSPSATNVYMAAGTVSPADLMADIKDGLYITEMIGFGINGVTGDYSRGATGFRIENGQLTYPVSEVTIAGNLLEMFARMVPADDLEFRYGTDAPTIRIDDMSLAGL
ncbi:TldD/PmbA family protein [Magnetospira sp. QH-2]|uniref:TldD/PmbA family protein n=1 Tax=Magnetospira sp. (strain QH-2) TaxID=1288970 RepID=UPI0003E80C4D|nr:metallopeptidase TldD-related protein [Magnetospira sp. QH-2]CCQ74669.1 putative Zn-dependent protease, pmbA-like protein [Magnetospira sp. QH-2]